MDLRTERKRLGVTQLQIAHESNIGPAVISLIDCGRLKPSPVQFKKITEALRRLENDQSK